MRKNLLGEPTISNAIELTAPGGNATSHSKFTEAMVNRINELADSSVTDEELLDILRVEPDAIVKIVGQSIIADDNRLAMQAKMNDPDYMAEATALAESMPTMKGMH